MSDFIVEKLTKSVGDKTVFKEISFIIHDLDRIGIIGVNGTGKTTLLDVVSERIGFDGDVSPFTKANGYKIAYLTQEPEFDDSKTVLDTVLSSDLREMALIREYETLMADYSEENQARLEKVMAEMDSLDAWSIERARSRQSCLSWDCQTSRKRSGTSQVVFVVVCSWLRFS